MAELVVKTAVRNQLVDVTLLVRKAVQESGVKEGLCIVYCPHTTAAITINENSDPAVVNDVLKKLSELVPANAGYAHAEGNSDAHIKASMIGNSRLVPIESGNLLLGTWEAIFFCEFDGPRERKLVVKVIKD
mgnify:CR=1 FL=1